MGKRKVKKGRQAMTASELIAELAADPVSQAERRRRDDELRRRSEEYARAEAPLVEDLRAAGAHVSSAWDLVNTTKPYPHLVPTLLSHLDRPYPERIREGIARALAIPESRSIWYELVRRYLAETDTTGRGVKWALHLSIAAAADLSVLDTLIKLALDRRHGRNRAMFVDALARLNAPRARRVLSELAGDPDLSGDVQRILKRKRSPRS